MSQTLTPLTKRMLSELANVQSEVRGTTLITYIVSGSTDLWLVRKHLEHEIATASNIKSKQTRNGVLDGLKGLLNTFENYCVKNKTPENGLVMLAGDINTKHLSIEFIESKSYI